MAEKTKIAGTIFLIVLLSLVSCKKEERSCFKGHGDESSLEIPLDSVYNWNLGQDIKYRIFQDSSRKLVVKGGENMIGLISAEMDGYDLAIENNNKCRFLRNQDRGIEVEIHYPHLGRFSIEPTDSVIFEGTIITDSLKVNMIHGGGSLVLDVISDYLQVVVSIGTGDFTLSGFSHYAEVKVQHRGFGDASKFTAGYLFAYQNSTADLYINLNGGSALVVIDGIGDVYAKGSPLQLTTKIVGSGELLTY